MKDSKPALNKRVDIAQPLDYFFLGIPDPHKRTMLGGYDKPTRG